ncbi:MAG: dynamin family protein [Gammaproteobacteria bacterium]|nr:dynamin family protein [Gammaproteobacteria bacterium]MDX2487382.1 dynamin family protein [Gammaproteobacteria bacterium]
MTKHGIIDDFEAYSEWRIQVRNVIKKYSDVAKAEDLTNANSEQRLNQIISTLNDDKLYIAFVAEFSRGKSELINAIFFSTLGKRVLPSSAGRTTMCPSELLYDHNFEPSIRLLPIDTRSSGTSIQEFKNMPEEWAEYPLNIDSPEQIAEVLKHITEVNTVKPEHAENLGLHITSDEGHEDGLHLDEKGEVEIPRWRHAIINFPHPLLDKGLVILDTPGLNALGAEPELTLNMLASAHGVMFILAADTGVTKSDLAVWRDHINMGEMTSRAKGRLVILNKIDVLWDELRDDDEISDEINRQVHETAKILNVDDKMIFPVSAQKALAAKIRGKNELLNKSRIMELEDALSDMLIPAKRDIVTDNVKRDMAEMDRSVKLIIEQRLSGVDEHISELAGLSSKNAEVIENMLLKVKTDKEHLERSLQRFQATRSIFTRQTVALYQYLDPKVMETTIAKTRKNMKISFTSRGIKTAMTNFFSSVYEAFNAASDQSNEIKELMQGVYSKFQEEHGLVNIRPGGYSTRKYLREIKRLEQSSERFVKTTSLVMLDQGVITERFFDSVSSRIRQIFQKANKDADNWLKTIMSPMESQIREHQIQLRRRLESIKRIHKASDTLDDRLAELKYVRDGIIEQGNKVNHINRKMENILASTEAEEESIARA